MAKLSRNDFGKLDASHTARAKLFSSDLAPSESKRLPDVPEGFVPWDGSLGAPAYDVSETDGSEEKTVSRKAVGTDEGGVGGSEH